jgi:hypothetical protein
MRSAKNLTRVRIREADEHTNTSGTSQSSWLYQEVLRPQRNICLNCGSTTVGSSLQDSGSIDTNVWQFERDISAEVAAPPPCACAW